MGKANYRAHTKYIRTAIEIPRVDRFRTDHRHLPEPDSRAEVEGAGVVADVEYRSGEAGAWAAPPRARLVRQTVRPAWPTAGRPRFGPLAPRSLPSRTGATSSRLFTVASTSAQALSTAGSQQGEISWRTGRRSFRTGAQMGARVRRLDTQRRLVARLPARRRVAGGGGVRLADWSILAPSAGALNGFWREPLRNA